MRNQSKNTFAITAMGRSGTQFLARTLNLSPSWTVRHEPIAGFPSLQEVNQRFDRDNYGEVNSFLRFQLHDITVEQKAVIIRDPLQIFASMYNRSKQDINHLNEALVALDSLIQSGIPVIQFSLMTESDSYIRNYVAPIVGITDLPEYLPLIRCNASIRILDLPPQLHHQVEQKTVWFRRLYQHLY